MNFSTLMNMAGLRPGAAAADVASIQQELGVSFPCDYAGLLAFSNGAFLENGCSIYPAEDVVERNRTFEIADYLPGYVLIGDDSGGTGILLSLVDGRVCLSGFGDLNPSDLTQLAPSLQAWIDSRFALG
jgi:hypothetical protein